MKFSLIYEIALPIDLEATTYRGVSLG